MAKLTIDLHESVDVNAAFAASDRSGHAATAISGVKVSDLARPDALVEVDAIVALP